MKLLILFFLLLFFAPVVQAQEIKLNSPIMATAGFGSDSESVSISKWRIGEVHLIVLDQKDELENAENFWEVSAYPNPFTESIKIRFDLNKQNEMMIQVTDLTGKKQLLNTKRQVLPDQEVQLNLSDLASGMYLLSVVPENRKTAQVMKIQKM